MHIIRTFLFVILLTVIGIAQEISVHKQHLKTVAGADNAALAGDVFQSTQGLGDVTDLAQIIFAQIQRGCFVVEANEVQMVVHPWFCPNSVSMAASATIKLPQA